MSTSTTARAQATPRRCLTAVAAVLVAATGCGGPAEDDAAPATGATTSPPAAETAAPSPTPDDDTRSEQQGVITGEDFGTAWRVEISEQDGEWCMTASAEGRTEQVCGDQVSLDERHGGREVLSVVEFELGELELTAGLVQEGVTRVRVETAPPPENPGGGATEEVETTDALVGLNAYAEADQDPTPGSPPELPTERVVALDLSGDQVGEVRPQEQRATGTPRPTASPA